MQWVWYSAELTFDTSSATFGKYCLPERSFLIENKGDDNSNLLHWVGGWIRGVHEMLSVVPSTGSTQEIVSRCYC